MPTYDYECKSCQHHWEEFQSIKAAPSQKCPECGKKSAQRMIGTGAGILFKGAGFYITDYRSDSYKKAASADSTASTGSKSETKSESKSESKTEAKSDSKPKKDPK